MTVPAADERLEARLEREGGEAALRLRGDLAAAEPSALAAMADDLAREVEGLLVVDVSEVPRLGGVAVTHLERLVRHLEERGLEVRVRPRDGQQRDMLVRFSTEPPRPEPEDQAEKSLLDRLGARSQRIQDAAVRYLNLLSRSLRAAIGQTVFRRATRNEQTFTSVLRMGVMATPLVALIAALIGFILGLQSAPILQRFGQEIMLAYLVGVSVTREIAPLLTAILVAGRSGSSLTAEIGTMVVSEEVDALEVMGVDPVGYLVAPRLRALFLALPVLTIIADVVGIVGGMVVGAVFLDIGPSAYLDATTRWVEVKDVVGGLVKALAFAIVIVSIAAHQGFSTSGGASGVGRFTTRSVVHAIIWIIVVDALFTWVLYAMEE